jgi:hypothetical protein
MTNYRKVTAILITAWFVAVLTASAFHLFSTPPGQPPLPLGLAVLVPIAAFWLWFRSSFLVLYSYGILPGLFALPAGWGDIVIGATAPLAALALADPKHRSSFIFWQVLGILDLVLAIFLGAADSFIHPQGIPTSPATMLPLSIIPTFLVPVLLILHLICIAQARRWPGVSANRDSTSALVGADV